MGAFIDLTGEKYGKLQVLHRIGTKNDSPLWECVCDCGNLKEATARSLRTGNTRSCGCIHSAQLADRNRNNKVHGGCADYKEERLYGVWHAMKQRCYDSNRKDYENYGGRGIGVCDEWRNDYSTFRDWAYLHGYDPNAAYMNCTLDRINVNGNYCPENCRFVSMKIQANNRRKRVKRDGNN